MKSSSLEIAPLAKPPQGSLGGTNPKEEEIDLRELIGVLIQGRWLLSSVLLLTMVTGIAYAIFAEPIYESDALVQVELEKKAIDAALGDVAELLGGEVEISAEIEILRSRMVLSRVIEELGLETFSAPNYFPVFGKAYARFVAPSTDGLAAPPLNLSALNAYAWGGERLELGSLVFPDQLLGEFLTLVVVAPQSYELLAPNGELLLLGKVGEAASVQTPYGRVDLFVKDLRARIGTEFEVLRKPRLQAIADLREDLQVSERGKKSGILAVSMRGPDPVETSEIVNRLLTAYQRQNVERKSAEAAQTLEFLESQLPKLKVDVEVAENAINQYRLKRGSADLAKETDLILQQSVQLETSRIELDRKREEALRGFTADHPAVRAIDAQIKDLGSAKDRINLAVKGLPETQQELLRLNRDMQVSTQLYTSLLNNAQELQVIKAGTVGNVRIVDPALPPLRPSEPKKGLVVVLSFLAGIFLGVVVVFLRRALHAGIEDPAQVERELGLTAYASVPYIPEQRRIEKEMGRGVAKNAILASADSENIAIEALRSLRTALHFGMVEAQNNIIVLTGPEPQIGKSFVSVNLGAVLATNGKKVLVIDMDLRRGRLHQYVGGGRAPGLTEFVTQTDQKVVRKTSVQGLDLITTGTLPPNPAELLMHPRTTELLKVLTHQYDYVIIDTPPILAVTDAALIARNAGTTLLVLKAGAHPMRMIEESMRRLQQGGVHLRGAIFNQVGIGGTQGYGYRYGYSPVYYTYKRAKS